MTKSARVLVDATQMRRIAATSTSRCSAEWRCGTSSTNTSDVEVARRTPSPASSFCPNDVSVRPPNVWAERRKAASSCTSDTHGVSHHLFSANETLGPLLNSSSGKRASAAATFTIAVFPEPGGPRSTSTRCPVLLPCSRCRRLLATHSCSSFTLSLCTANSVDVVGANFSDQMSLS